LQVLQPLEPPTETVSPLEERLCAAKSESMRWVASLPHFGQRIGASA
jgi:hypothetical protein